MLGGVQGLHSRLDDHHGSQLWDTAAEEELGAEERDGGKETIVGLVHRDLEEQAADEERDDAHLRAAGRGKGR